MMVKDEPLSTRSNLTGAQRALLEERLQRAKQAAGAKAAEARPTIPRRPVSLKELPLSLAQERLWFLDQLEPASAVYNLCQAVRLRGSLDVPALERALQEIVQRHEALRTNFTAVEGNPVQVVAPQLKLVLPLADLSAGPGDKGAEVRRKLEEEARRPFDLARDPLVRALLVRTSPTEHTLLVTMHHIISDGWSVGVFIRELTALYAGLVAGEAPKLPELPIQFADHALWEREQLAGAALDKALAYWKKQLGGSLPTLELPLDHPRAESAGRGATRTVQLSPATTQAVKALGQQEGATLFMTLLAAFHVLLHRYTGQADIVTGSVVAGRRKVELEKLIGFFVNTLVFRGDLSGNPSFRELLRRTRDLSLAAFAHQDVPFDRLVRELRPERVSSRNPLFQVMFVLQNAPLPPAELPGLGVEPVDVETGTAKFDLMLTLADAPEGLRAACEYNAELFEEATIARLLANFQTLVDGIVATPDSALSQLPLLTEAERRQVLADFNRTACSYPAHETIASLFAAQAALAPQTVAVSFAGRPLTYRELDARANQLAHVLRRRGVGPGQLVGVCLDRSFELIVALLGILKAGGAYVSLDPAYPRERLAFMLEDTQTSVLLTQERLRSLVEDLAGKAKARPGVLCLDSDWAEIARERTEAPTPTGGPESLAYVSYTSGSTGLPKGVCVPQRGVVRLVKDTDFAQFGPDEVFLQYAPVAFDASTLEIWGALLNGGRLVVFPPGPASLADLGEFIERQGITTLWLTAGLFHQMVEEQVGRLKHVRQLLAGGDVLSVPHVTRALQQLPRTRLINGYGPTENTTFTCCHAISTPPAADRSVPIGRPIANTQVYILDRALQPVPIGVPGELFAGGDGLALGYLNRPELTQEKFIAHPFGADSGARLYRTGDLARWRPDGTVEFLGRLDRQVKIRGFRVEPAEIENALASHPGVKECAVVVRDDAAGGKSLVAFVVPKAGAAGGVETWRSHLDKTLPEHLVPSLFVPLDALPLTPNGKVDEAALPAANGARPDLQDQALAPRDAVERHLVEIWEDVLNVRPIGVRDRFFELGGHSLLAVRMAARVEKAFGRKLPIAAIFQHRTIEHLARFLRTGEAVAPASSIVEIQGHGQRPPLYLVHGVGGGMFWGYSNLARHLGAEQPIYGFKSRGLDGQPEWPTIEEMAAAYVADLRARQPEGPYLLGGYCFGGVVAYEMARQLQEQGEEIGMLALMNCSPPNTNYEQTGSRLSPRWQLKFLGNIAYWLGCFAFQWSVRERLEFVRWKLRLLRKKAVGAPQGASELAVTDVDEMVNLAAYSERQRKLWQAHVQALKNYRPQPYAGAVTLFRTRGHALLCSFDPLYGWGDLVRGGVTLRIMPGGHGSILDEPHVRAVARALRGCLDSLGLRRSSGAAAPQR